MTRKDYVQLAEIVGMTLAAAYTKGGEQVRTAVYDSLYHGTVSLLAADNPRFDRHRFAHAVGEAELAMMHGFAESRAGTQ